MYIMQRHHARSIINIPLINILYLLINILVSMLNIISNASKERLNAVGRLTSIISTTYTDSRVFVCDVRYCQVQ